jgi:electron transport complex protein RnfC
VQPVVIPSRLYLPLHPDAELLVKPAQKVLAGQPLTSVEQTRSAIWHAPVSATVIEVTNHPLPESSGRTGPTLVLEPDGRVDAVEFNGPGWSGLSLQGLQDVARAAGLAGMGGAGFPTWIKLGSATARPISTLIINGVECEPDISCDAMLMREQPAKVVVATANLAALLQVDRALIALEDDSPEVLTALQGVTETTSSVEVVELPTRYPSGSEKQLIENLLGKQVPKGRSPSDIGVLCLNVATLCALDDAANDGRPLVSRIVTVTGEGVAQPQNREVLLGTTASDLLDACGGLIGEVDDLVMGGPMMGFALASPLTPMVKISNCLLVRPEPVMSRQQPVMPCIRCGDCGDVCPADLLPQQLYWFSKSGEHDKAERHNLFDCIECGACAYVCPSKLPLVDYYRVAKREIRNQRLQLSRADVARERMLARDERLVRRDQEAAERRLKKRGGRKTSGAADKQPLSAEAQAAMDRARSLQQAVIAETAQAENQESAGNKSIPPGNQTDSAGD